MAGRYLYTNTMKKRFISNNRVPTHNPCGNVSNSHQPKLPCDGGAGSSNREQPHTGQTASAIPGQSKQLP
jgi:hypothetical protein